MKSIKIVIFVFIHIASSTTYLEKDCNCKYFYPKSLKCLEYCENDKSILSEIDKSTESHDVIFKKPKTSILINAIPSQNKIDGTVVPTYALYLIGFFMLLLIVVSIVLGILLFRTKVREYKVFVSQPTPNATFDRNPAKIYVTQSSQDMSLLNLNSQQDDRKSDTASKNGEPNGIPESVPPPSNALKIYKSVRKPVDHQMIRKEQMKKICEDALAKAQNSGLTASLKDLNKLLNDVDTEKRKQSHENIVREKSASFPQLDIYDEAPSNIPVNNVNNEEDIPVYDCVTRSNNIVVRDNATSYMLPLSTHSIDNDSEPSYINAKYRLY